MAPAWLYFVLIYWLDLSVEIVRDLQNLKVTFAFSIVKELTVPFTLLLYFPVEINI